MRAGRWDGYGFGVTSTQASDSIPGLDQPLYGASPGSSLRRFWLKYVTFTGRASRAEYWWVWLVNGLISAVVLVITLLIESVLTEQSWLHLWEAASPVADALQAVWLAATVVPTLAVSMRRLHDTNRSGWWCLLLAPVLAINVWSIVADLSPSFFYLTTGAGGTAVQFVFAAASILMLVFVVSGPKPDGERFDRDHQTTSGTTELRGDPPSRGR